MLKTILRLTGAIQIILGLAYLFAPDALLAAMGHSPVAADIHYPFAMLASRFLVYGAALLIAARTPERHVVLIRLMGAIQAIDLAAGIVFTVQGTVPLSLSGFPMVNAIWIGLAAGFWPIGDARGRRVMAA